MPHPAGTQVEGLQEVVALLLLGREPGLEAQLRISWQRKEEGHSIPGRTKSLRGHPGTFCQVLVSGLSESVGGLQALSLC